MIPMPEMAGILAILEMVLISARLILSLGQLISLDREKLQAAARESLKR